MKFGEIHARALTDYTGLVSVISSALGGKKEGSSGNSLEGYENAAGGASSLEDAVANINRAMRIA